MTCRRLGGTALLGLAFSCLATPAGAQTAPTLGTAGSFAVLAGSTVTNTGPTTITGSLGVSPGSTVTGFPPGIVFPPGTMHAGDAVALQAKNDLTTAFNNLAGQACTSDLTGQDLGGLTLLPGVYCFSSSAQLTGTLTLNALGNPDSVFIFKMASTITTASNSSVLIINGGSVCNVFWQVGSSATLGTTTTFVGNILALTSITLNTTATVAGRVLARNGAVTLDSNNVSASSCSTVTPPTPPPTPGPTPPPGSPPPAGCPAITLAPPPNPTVGVAYQHQLVAGGGTEPYTFAVNVGGLPAGLALSAAGMISGTPSAGGTVSFTVRATDANGCFLERSFTVVTSTGVPTLPQAFVVLLALGLATAGYLRLRRVAAE